MTPVRVTCLALDTDVPPHETEGFVPWSECPLAVASVPIFNYATRKWRDTERWCVLHRATGYDLGNYEFETRDDAMAALMLCDPHFGAWPLATGKIGDAATLACRSKFRAVEAAP